MRYLSTYYEKLGGHSETFKMLNNHFRIWLVLLPSSATFNQYLTPSYNSQKMPLSFLLDIFSCIFEPILFSNLSAYHLNSCSYMSVRGTTRSSDFCWKPRILKFLSRTSLPTLEYLNHIFDEKEENDFGKPSPLKDGCNNAELPRQ